MRALNGVFALVATLVFGFSFGTASAATISLQSGHLGNANNGGMFLATLSGDLGLGNGVKPINYDGNNSGPFEVFCLERDNNEAFNYGYSYDLNTDNYTHAINGGGNADPHTSGAPDPLSLATAYLYWQFLDHKLSNYAHDDDHANALQAAIWYLEDELLPLDVDHTKVDLSLSTLSLSSAEHLYAHNWITEALTWEGSHSWGNLGMNVVVLNLEYTDTNGTTHQIQSQLAGVTSGVPAPAAGLLALMGFGILGLARRRLGRWLS